MNAARKIKKNTWSDRKDIRNSGEWSCVSPNRGSWRGLWMEIREKVGGRPRFAETLPICRHLLRRTGWVDQLQDLLRPVEDSHAEPPDILGVVGLGVAGDVGPAEAVRGAPVEPGERGRHELRYRLGLRLLPVAALRFKGPVDCMTQLVKEDVRILCGKDDGLV